MKPEKVLEPFFLSKVFHSKMIIRTRLTLYWNTLVVFVLMLLIFPHLCALFLRFEDQVSAHWDKEDISTVDKEDGSSMMVISCAIRFSENFFKKLIVSTLSKPQYIRKYIQEDLFKVLFNLSNQKPLYYVFIYLKK